MRYPHTALPTPPRSAVLQLHPLEVQGTPCVWCPGIPGLLGKQPLWRWLPPPRPLPGCWAGPWRGGPGAGLAGARAAPLHTSLAGREQPAAGRRLCSASLGAGIMGGPAAADAVLEAGRGRALGLEGRGGRVQARSGALGSPEAREPKQENKTLEGAGAHQCWGGSWSRKMVRAAFLLPAPSPPVRWGLCRTALLLDCYQPASPVSLASFAGGNKCS